MTDLHQAAEDIREQFEDRLDLEVEAVEDRLDTLVNEYSVPSDEARRSVISHYLEEADMDREELSGGGSEEVDVADVDTAEEWIDLTVTVVDLWEPRSDSVAQVGLVGDETGTIKFTKWAKSDLPDLELDQAYHLSNVVTDEYEGRFSVKLNRTTTIDPIEETIDVGDQTVTAEGALIDVQSGSGLIKRCPEEECTRVLQNGRCSEHGEVEGEFDLRIKAVLDDGESVHEVIFDQTATENLTGMTLEEAKDMAMDALDTSVVAEEMCADIVGRYYRVEGPQYGRYVLADDVERLSEPTDPGATLIKARSI
jgi:replication factor A1